MFPGVCQSGSTVPTRAAPPGAPYCPNAFLVEQREAVGIWTLRSRCPWSQHILQPPMLLDSGGEG